MAQHLKDNRLTVALLLRFLEELRVKSIADLEGLTLEGRISLLSKFETVLNSEREAFCKLLRIDGAEKEDGERETKNVKVCDIKVRAWEILTELDKAESVGLTRQNEAIAKLEHEICDLFQLPSDSWIPIDATLQDLIRKVEMCSSISGQHLELRQQPSGSVLLQTLCGGRALQGLLITQKIEDQLQDRSQLLEVPENVSVSRAYRYDEHIEHFSSLQQEKNCKKRNGFLGCSVANVLHKSNSSEIEEENDYLSTVKISSLQIARISLKEKDLSLCGSAKRDLNSILEIKSDCTYSGEELQKACKDFFYTYGSHVNRGPFTFGGNCYCTCSSTSYISDRHAVKEMQQSALSTPGVGIDFSKVIDFSELYKDKCSEDTLSDTQLSIDLEGGPPESRDADIFNWRSGLLADSNSWILIDRGTKVTTVWDIISNAQEEEFRGLGEVLRAAWEKMTGFEQDPLMIYYFDSNEVLEKVSLWKGKSTAQQIEDRLKYLWRVKAANPSVWSSNYLSEISLQNFLLQVALESEKLWPLMRELVDKDDLAQLNPLIYPRIKHISVCLYKFEMPEKETFNFQSLDKKLEEIQKHAIEAAATKNIADLILYEAVAQEVSGALNLLLLHCRDAYEKALITILMHSFLVCGNSNIKLKPLTLEDLQFLHQCFKEHKIKYDQYFLLHKQSPLHLQAYLLNLAIDLSGQGQLHQLLVKVGKILDTILEERLRERFSTQISCLNHQESFRNYLQTLASPQAHPDDMSLQNVLSEYQHKTYYTVAPSSTISPDLANNEAACELLQKLDLSKHYPKRLQMQDALCVQSEPLQLSLKKDVVTDTKQLARLVLHKIMSYDSLCRTDLMTSADDEDDCDDCSDSSGIHPMDIILALILCMDDILRQDIFSRLAKCQLSVPFILPDPFTKKLTVPLWAMRSIIKEWCIGEKVRTHAIICHKMPIVSFIRFGNAKVSKSKLLNDVIGELHFDHYFHRDCPGGQYNHVLGDGLVDVCWYLPSGQPAADVFSLAITFLNLHGDARDHPQQIKLLSHISSLCVVLIANDLEVDERIKQLLKSFSSVLILAEQDLKALEAEIPHICPHVKTKNRNAAQLKGRVRIQIKKVLKSVKEFGSVEDTVNHFFTEQIHAGKQPPKYGTEFAFVDESSELYKCLSDEARDLFALCQVKGDMLPLQGKDLWKAWAANEKELYRQFQRGRLTVNEYTEEVKTKQAKVRGEQLKHVESLTPLMKLFIESLLKFGGSSNKISRNYFLQCLKLDLNDASRKRMSDLLDQYISTKRDLLCIQENTAQKSLLLTKLKELQDTIIASSFGLEHILRELGQVYEAALQAYHYGNDLSCLPKAAAELLIDGWPLELMDGDAAHVPLQWVEAVLKEAVRILNDPKVFVLSVLGLQSTGKSTMLNTVFGLQFNVSAGRCTRGAFMQLLPLDEELRRKTKCSYVLVVDTEGLRDPILDPLLTQKHDNELATFVIGLANMTLINIYGEVPGDMDDILQTSVHAFLRMTQVKYTPSCQFVHQNAGANLQSEVGRAKFTQKLDKLTVDAAREENCEGQYRCFNDVIKFDDQTNVHHFPGLWNGDPPMAHVSQGYTIAAQMIKHHFVDILCRRASDERSATTGLSLFSLQGKIKDLWRCLLKENFVFSFKNTLEITAYHSLEAEYSKWEWSFQEKMLEWERKAANEINAAAAADEEDTSKVSSLVQQKCMELLKHVSEESQKLEEVMNDYFNGKQSEILAQWKGKFQARLRNLALELRKHAENHCKSLGESKALISKFERERAKYTEIITWEVQEHIASIKREQEKLNRSLQDKQLESEQLQKILEKNIFSHDSLERYKECRLITADQASQIYATVQAHGGLTKVCLNEILVGPILSTEEVKSILKMKQQAGGELLPKFNSLWNDMMSKVSFETGHENIINVFLQIETKLRDFVQVKGHEGTLICKLNERSLDKWGDIVVTKKHYTRKYKIVTRNVLTQWNQDPQEIVTSVTKTVYNEAMHYLTTTLEKNVNFNAAFVLELLRLIDSRIDRESKNIEFFVLTVEYRLDQYLTLCCHSIPFFEEMAESFRRRNDPRQYLEENVKGILFAKFKNQYYQAKAEEAIASTLCAFLEEPVKAQVRKVMGSKMVGKMKESRHYFSSKMALKTQILRDLRDRDKFDDYYSYLTNVKICFEKWLKYYTVEYCNELESLENTRLQIAAKEEVSRLICVVITSVSEVKETEIKEWLFALCSDQTLKSELGINLKVDTLLGEHDPANLQNLKCEIESELAELENKLHAAFDKARCEVEMLDWSEKPHDIFKNLIGCTEQCPFCGEQCDSQDPNHEGEKHVIAIHRPSCLGGYRYISSQEMVVDFCPAKVAGANTFKNAETGETSHPYKDYQSIYPNWHIPADPTAKDSLYWKSFVAKYMVEIAETFIAKPANVPEQWLAITPEDIEKDLNDIYTNRKQDVEEEIELSHNQ